MHRNSYLRSFLVAILTPYCSYYLHKKYITPTCYCWHQQLTNYFWVFLLSSINALFLSFLAKTNKQTNFWCCICWTFKFTLCNLPYFEYVRVHLYRNTFCKTLLLWQNKFICTMYMADPIANSDVVFLFNSHRWDSTQVSGYNYNTHWGELYWIWTNHTRMSAYKTAFTF